MVSPRTSVEFGSGLGKEGLSASATTAATSHNKNGKLLLRIFGRHIGVLKPNHHIVIRAREFSPPAEPSEVSTGYVG